MKTVLITGATSGIGLAGAEALARRGWRVLVHARNAERAREPWAALTRAVPEGRFELVTGDLSSLAEVVDLASQVRSAAPRLDALWNNAGGLLPEYRTSVDGFELQWAVNHLAPFVLTHQLRPQLEAAGAARVVATSSMAHAFGGVPTGPWFQVPREPYPAFRTYGRTKLANLLFTQECQRRWASSTITAHAFHPGWVNTGFGSSGQPRRRTWATVLTETFALAPEAGADTGVFLVDEAGVEARPGLYWAKRRPRRPSSAATASEAQRLWAETEAAVRAFLPSGA